MPAILIKEFPEALHARARQAAAARGLMLGEYFERLVQLHDDIRALADAGDNRLQTELERLGLQTIHA